MKNFSIRDVAFIGAAGSGAADASFIDETSLKIRLQGDRGVTIGGVPVVTGNPLDTWANQVIGEANAVQATGASQPLWIDAGTPGGRGIIRFDGTNDFLTIPHGATTNLTNPLTFYAAVKINDLANFGMLFTKGPNGTNQQYSHYVTATTGTITVCGTGGTCHVTNSGALVAGTWYRIIVRWNTSVTQTQIYINAIKRNPTQSLLTNFASTDAMQIGRRIDGLYGEYDLAEAGLFNRNISDAEITALDNYLVAQYGI